MTIFSFYLFDRHCECIYHREWNTTPTSTKRLSASIPAPNELFNRAPRASLLPNSNDTVIRNKSDDAKLVFGVIYSLRSMVRKLTDQDSFISFKTSKYRLHYFEPPSNLKFVLITDPKVDNMRVVLQEIYSTLYVEFVVKNPLSPIEHPGGEGVNTELFTLGLDSFITSLTSFQ